MYLRIAFELYLKRLISGGYERVYEIGRDFRNEGFDRSHSPEFTMVEWYEAYADYHRVMDVTEGLFKYLAEKINSSSKMKIDEKEVDLAGKWPRIPMSDIMKRELGIDVESATEAELIELCKKEGAELIGGETKGQLIFALFEHTIPPKLIEPTWIIDYPEDVSPLSKNHRSKPGWVERFEGYIGGKEICDGWSELTDPLIQRQRFENDQKASRKDKSEAQQLDEDFIAAMEYGMPPMGGIGIGIERLTMFFTNMWAIREVMLFPTLKKMGHTAETHEAQPVKQAVQNPYSISRDRAFALVKEKLTSPHLVKHSLAVEAAMRALARRLGGDESRWGVVGLLHDVDWDATKDAPDQHTRKTVEWLTELGHTDSELHRAILAHNHHHNGEGEPTTPMEWALYTCDELTGLIVAVTLVQPSRKIAEITTESVLKKFPSKSFAAGVNRQQIQMCDEKLGIPIQEFVTIVLKSMQEIQKELGL
jgi:lysyl-tRNA synthetase class 2